MEARTDTMETKLQKIEELREFVLERIEENCLSITDEIESEEIADFVTKTINHLRVWNTYSVLLDTYRVKIKNSLYGSFLSISSDDSTGVSRSEYYIVDEDNMDTQEIVDGILEMLDEAYYFMNK